MDRVSPASRSRIMSAIRASGNRTTELRLRAHLARSGVRGWTIRPRGMIGNPDFAFADDRIAIFVDGCFWHGCPKCSRPPSSNRSYWVPKLEGTRRRDRRVSAALRREGWSVVRIWEHDLREAPDRAVARVRRRLRTGRPAGAH